MNVFHVFCVRNGLFKGKDLIEELAFVRYFHHNHINVVLHILGFHLLLVGFLLLLYLISPLHLLDIYFILCYTAGMVLMDDFGGVCPTSAVILLLCAGVARCTGSYCSSPGLAASIAALLAASSAVLQFYGHIYCDKSQPAFRVFEAFFTTPYYLHLYICCKVYKSKANAKKMEQVVKKTMMWRGSERVTYGERQFCED